jgi:TM2 domain-containing membrane protein YozV
MSTEPAAEPPTGHAGSVPQPEVIKQLPYIQPSHISDINHWKHPDRNFYFFIVLSFVFGFMGIDHFYLRSFGTGIQKFGFNMVSFGMWYFWDLIQIVTEGKKIQEEGLTTPFDWVRGIGRGVFENPTAATATAGGGLASSSGSESQSGGAAPKGGKVMMAKKDIFIYSILTVMFGIFGIDKLYLGEPLQAVAKMLTCFNIFIFLFGWLWVIWDIVKVFLFTDSLMKNGISPPPPFSFMFTTPISAQDLFIPHEVSAEEAAGKGLFSSITGMFMPRKGALPALPVLPDVPVCAPVPAWAPLLVPKLDVPAFPTDMSLVSADALPTARMEAPALPPLPSVSSVLPSVAAPAPAPSNAPGPSAAASAPVPSNAPGPSAAASAPATAAAAAGAPSASASAPAPAPDSAPSSSPASTVSKPLHKGGGRNEDYSDLGTPGPIIAGTLAAVVLAGAAKFISEVLTDKK